MSDLLGDALAAGPGWPADPEPREGPLAGIRVLDLSRVLAGPYATTVLADLGADVLKVERPGAGDDTRGWGPPFVGSDAVYFLSVNRDRRSLVLDLSRPAGARVLRSLAGSADVVVENFLPGHLERLGLRQVREDTDAVWVSVRGAAGDGPDGARPGYDVMAQARSGLMSVTGTDSPTKVGVAVTDVVTGLYAAIGALAGLLSRRALRVEVGLLEAAVSMLVNQAGNALLGGQAPTFTGNDHPNLAPYGPVPCADGPLVVGAGNDAQFAALARAVGIEALPGWDSNAGRLADREHLAAALAAAMGARTVGEWLEVLGTAGVPCAPVQSVAELPADPQLVATGLFQTVAHPAGPLTLVGSPLRVDGARPQVRRPPPLLGEHTEQALAALGVPTELWEEVSGAHRG